MTDILSIIWPQYKLFAVHIVNIRAIPKMAQSNTIIRACFVTHIYNAAVCKPVGSLIRILHVYTRIQYAKIIK